MHLLGVRISEVNLGFIEEPNAELGINRENVREVSISIIKGRHHRREQSGTFKT